jgi:HAD superfamily hydrolase (TIGR01549 family)
MSHKVFSFDIFDTCITRNYAIPRHLFFDLANNFLKKFAPYGYDQQSIIVFARSRHLAERQARLVNKSKLEDITLNHIYQRLSRLLPWNFDLEHAMKLEMELEKSSLHSVLQVKLHIEQLRQQGHRIIFISDMYLPTAFLYQCLFEKGIANRDDSIYVSGDMGLTKASGNLFKKVIELEGIKPSQLVHCGDNFHSDIKMPSQLGIRPHHFTGTHLTQFEQLGLKKAAKNNVLPICSKLVGASRLARLNLAASDHATPTEHLISSVALPLLTSYVAWVLKDAQERNMQRLYFVSRDGQILLKIAQALCKGQQNEPELRYLYGSRQAWFLPSVMENDWSEFEWLVQGQSNRLYELLDRLSINTEEIYPYLTMFNLELCLEKEVKGVLLERFRDFIQHPHVFDRIQKYADQLRSPTLEYFRQEGLFDGKRWALVDLGWQLNCQHAITRLLRTINPNSLAQGYYLGIRKNAVIERKTGPRFAFINQDRTGFIKDSCNWLFRSNVHVIIEDIFTPADHASVIFYEKKNGHVVPVFAKQSPQTLSHNVCNATTNYLNFIAVNDLFDALEAFAKIAVKNAEIFFTKPDKNDVEVLADLIINRDQSHDPNYDRKLASSMTFREVLRLMTGNGYNLHRHVWLEGSAQLSLLLPRQLLKLTLTIRNFIHERSVG